MTQNLSSHYVFYVAGQNRKHFAGSQGIVHLASPPSAHAITKLEAKPEIPNFSIRSSRGVDSDKQTGNFFTNE